MIKIISTSKGVSKGLASTFRRVLPTPQKLITNIDVKKSYIDKLIPYISGSNLKNIIKLMDNNKIVPVECTNDFINSLNQNLKGDACMNPNEYKNVLGFYTGQQNRLYILLDNINKMTSDSKSVVYVTVHELQHMCCYNNVTQFIQLWKPQLNKFYAYFCANLYKSYVSGVRSMWNTLSRKDQQVIQNLLNPDNGISYLVQYLIFNHEYLYCCVGSNVSTSDCKAIGFKIGMLLQNNGCEDGVSETIASKISNISKDIFTGNISKTWNNKDNSIIIDCLRQSYISTFNKDPWKDGTFIYQEVIFPSEVISISSQYNYKNNNYYKFLGTI
jgi:hypothetical protein